jgi:WD40 repeat protein
MHDECPTVSPEVTVEIEQPVSEPTSEDVFVPEHAALPAKPIDQIDPAHAEAEDRIARIGNTPGSEAFPTAANLIHPVSPHETETVHDILLPPPLTGPPMIATHERVETTPSLPLPPVDPNSLEMADALLELAKTTLTENPEKCVEQTVRAAQIYKQHGHPLPQSLYWILSNAFASRAWGEPLLESAPAVETMTLSPDSRYLLAQLRDRTVRLWDLQSSEHERSARLLDPGTAEYVKFIFAPNLRWIIGGQKNGMIRIWDMSLRNPAEATITLKERVPDLQDLQIAPNGQWLAAFGHAPREVTVAEKQSAGKPIQQVKHQKERSQSPLDTSPYPVLLWNLCPMEAGGIPAVMPVSSVSQQPAQVIRFSPNSDRLAVGRKDAVVWVYDLTARGVNDDPIVLRGHQLGITQIAFAPCGEWIATGSQDNTIRLWELLNSKSPAEATTLYGHIGWISALLIDASEEYIFSGSYDRTIRIWNVKRDRLDSASNRGSTVLLETSLGIPETLLVTQDGDKMIARGNEGSLGIYHLPSLLGGDSAVPSQSVTFRNRKLSISQCFLTGDDQCLIFSYEHLLNSANSGIRLWSLQPYSFVQ